MQAEEKERPAEIDNALAVQLESVNRRPTHWRSSDDAQGVIVPLEVARPFVNSWVVERNILSGLRIGRGDPGVLDVVASLA